MKGNSKVISALNGLLASELAAVNQYTAHYLALENWGFEELAALVADRAKDERRHARKIALRILALEGVPNFADLAPVKAVFSEIPGQIAADAAAEENAIQQTNEAIRMAVEAGDNTTAHILDHIVREESDHLNEIEGWRDQIAMLGLPGFLSEKVN